MDEQTFRRLAPDAVAGRLDTATYERWKAATGENPERASFVVRVAEADAKVSGSYEPIKHVTAREPVRRVPKRTAIGLGIAFALVGLLAGALAMNSYIRAQKRIGDNKTAMLLQGNDVRQPANQPDNLQAEPTPAADPQPAPTNAPDNTPHQTDPEPDPPPDLPPPTEGFQLLAGAAGLVSVRGEKDDRWRRLEPGEPLADGDSVSCNEDGAARFEAPGLVLSIQQPAQFEYRGGAVRFIAGRVAVRVRSDWKFSCYKSEWSTLRADFVVEPKTLGGDLYLIDGGIMAGNVVYAAPERIALDGSGTSSILRAEQIVALESELLGPHIVLLHWDCETNETTPRYGELVQPGALGAGHAVTRKPGDPGIGVSAPTVVFAGESGARLRMRVKTDAARVRIEFRVQLDSGFRLVDALVDVDSSGEWAVVDIPLEVLRAGRYRDEPGWLPGRDYSGFLLVPAADPARPLTRHEFVIDDLLIYAPK
ncbi:MAG: hypothetical protein KDB90_06960 [Planctomycetes bacterium]|nr:hypothetical protein [Planctomycetota bacterium]